MKSAIPAIVAASRRRTATPSVLGYSTKDTVDSSSLAVGRMYVSKFTLATSKTLNELRGWFGGPTAASVQVRVVIYAADGSGGNPGTRLAYTGVKTYSGDTEVFETGFSVALAAADYWIGFLGVANGSGGAPVCWAGTGGTHAGLVSGASNPPPTPFGSPTTTGTRKHCCWAVVS